MMSGIDCIWLPPGLRVDIENVVAAVACAIRVLRRFWASASFAGKDSLTDSSEGQPPKPSTASGIRSSAPRGLHAKG